MKSNSQNEGKCGCEMWLTWWVHSQPAYRERRVSGPQVWRDKADDGCCFPYVYHHGHRPGWKRPESGSLRPLKIISEGRERGSRDRHGNIYRYIQCVCVCAYCIQARLPADTTRLRADSQWQLLISQLTASQHWGLHTRIHSCTAVHLNKSLCYWHKHSKDTDICKQKHTCNNQEQLM